MNKWIESFIDGKPEYPVKAAIICELYGKKVKYASCNSFHGFYCEDCLRLVNYENRESIKAIKERRKREKVLKCLKP